jgi:hypothetical protein
VDIDGVDALPIAGNALATYAWWRQLGGGEVWVFAGSDFAENSRIEDADNLELWQTLAARGPMLFDESHHRAGSKSASAAARALWIVVGQFVACALFFAYARGARLGPPRPEIAERHRSSREYLESLAWLTRRAGVEKELLREEMGRLRTAMFERLGVPVSLSDEEAAQSLEQHHLRGERLVRLSERLRRSLASPRASPSEFAELARECARLEALIAGRKPR